MKGKATNSMKNQVIMQNKYMFDGTDYSNVVVVSCNRDVFFVEKYTRLYGWVYLCKRVFCNMVAK